MSLLPWWDDLDFDAEPDAAIYAEETLTVSSGVVSWSAAASVFDFDE
jgi:hypothetical protein